MRCPYSITGKGGAFLLSIYITDRQPLLAFVQNAGINSQRRILLEFIGIVLLAVGLMIVFRGASAISLPTQHHLIVETYGGIVFPHSTPITLALW